MSHIVEARSGLNGNKYSDLEFKDSEQNQSIFFVLSVQSEITVCARDKTVKPQECLSELKSAR